MLRINSLKLKHFMCCTSAELEFKDAEIIVLNGENGSGKSSTLDAIAICLCEHKRADRYNDFVQKGFNEAEIQMDATIGGEPILFNIKMHYSKGAALERDILYKGQHYVNSEATPLLQSLDLPFYSTIIFSMQGDADVASMSPTARAIFLQKLLQFDFEDQSSHLKETIEDLENTKTYNSNQIEFIKNELKTKVLKELETLPLTDDEKLDLFNKSNTLSKKLNDRSLFYKNKDQLIEQQKIILNKISQRDKELAIFKQWEEANKSTTEYLNKAMADLNTFEADFNISDFEEKQTTLKSQIDEIPDLWKKASEDRDKTVAYLAEYKSQKSNLQNKNELLKSGKCPHCGQSTAFLKEEHIVEALEDIENKIIESTKAIENYDSEMNSYRQKTYSLQSQLTEITNDKSKKETKYNSLKELVDVYTSRLENSKKRTPIINEYPEDLEKNLEDINTSLEDLNKKINSLNEVEAELSNINNSLLKYSEIENRNKWILEENKKKEMEIKKGNETIDSLQQANISLTNDQKDYIDARKLIDNDLPNFLIIKTCGKLEEEMNNFIQVVFPTMKVRLFQNKKGVEFFYTRDASKGSENKADLINTKMASGFEKSLLSIAFKVALCRAYNLSFVVLDEIDAFATDLSSSKIFQSLIESKAFDQIFIITHKPSTREAIQEASDSCIVYHVEKGKFSIEEDE